MTIQDYLRVARDRWKIIVSLMLVGVLAAITVFLVRPPQYTASVSLYVSAQLGSNDPQQAFQGAQLSEQRVKSYNELVTGDRVMNETVARLGLNLTPEQLTARVTASSPLDSVIIDITATDQSPQRAATIANTIAATTSQVVDELERPTAPNDTPPVAVRVVQPARVPDQPSSTGLPIMLAIGLLAGAAVGVGSALLRNALDTSVRTASALASAVGAPVLGVTAHDETVPKRPLTVYDDPHSPRSEAFRQLRTNLQFVDVDKPRKVIMITSAIPGEGKTTGVANLAIALASTGKRILVVEADLRRPMLSSLLGVDRSVGLTRVLSGRISLTKAIQPWRGGTFDLLASGPTPPNPSELLASNQMRTLIEEAKTSYDTILIDTPPLLPVTDAAAIAPATDGALMFCRFNSTTRPQVEAAAAALRAVSVDCLGTVLTMAPPAMGPMGYAAYNIRYETRPSDPELGHTTTRRSGRDVDVSTERTFQQTRTVEHAGPERRAGDSDGRTGRR